MFHWTENQSGLRLFQSVVALLVGEACGFALTAYASIWLEVGALACAFLLLFFVRTGKVPFRCILFAWGLVMAFRADAFLTRTLDENMGLMGKRPSLALRVEEPLTYLEAKNRKFARLCFSSHIGFLPVRAVVPLAPQQTPPRLGEIWQVNGWISKRETCTHRFQRRAIWVARPEEAHRLQASFPRTFHSWTQLGEHLVQVMGLGLGWDPELAQLNGAILLGRRNGLTPEMRETFSRAGTIHVFAISGLHVVIVAWLINSCLAFLNLSSRTRALFCIPLLCVYVVITGARASAIRAAVMTTLWLVAPLMNRRGNLLTAWCTTALLVYGFSPTRFFDLGCALSFMVMLGILMWLGWCKRVKLPFLLPRPIASLAMGLGVSFAAWVAGTPLAAAAFGRWTPGGLLANFVVIACAGLLVKWGLSALLISVFCVPLAALFNNCAAAMTEMMKFVSVQVARLSFASFNVEPWDLKECFIWYACWLVFFVVLDYFLPRRSIKLARSID